MRIKGNFSSYMLPNKYFCKAILPLLFFLTQCSTYQPLNNRSLSYQTIHVKPLKNKTLATEVNAPFMNAVRKQIIRQSSLSIIENKQADVVLEVYLVSFDKSANATESNDPTKSRSYNFQFCVEANLWDNHLEKYHFYKKAFKSSKSIRNDFLKDSSAEYQDIPILIDQLANQIVSVIVNPWM